MSTRLERLLHMDRMIRSGNYPSVKTFIDRFEVSESTVYHDIQFLRDRLYAPLEYSRVHQGYCYTDQSWNLPTLAVTEGQLLALFLSIELTERYLGTSFEQPLREAIQQIAEMLPDEMQVSMSELAHHYSIRPGASAKTPPETLVALQKAIRDRHPVDMVYFTASRGEENQRIVHPYHLLNIRGEWYLIAYDQLRQNIRQFALLVSAVGASSPKITLSSTRHSLLRTTSAKASRPNTETRLSKLFSSSTPIKPAICENANGTNRKRLKIGQMGA